jgi:Ca2+-binding EF-hand superfamily protein
MKAPAGLALVMAALLTRAALAEEEAPAPPPVEEEPAKEAKDKSHKDIALEGFDSDKDGLISLHELLEHVHANPDKMDDPAVQGWNEGFKQADTNKDMHLDADELDSLFAQAMKKKTLGEIALEGFDDDKDGQISLHELLEHVHANPEVANHPDFKGWNDGFKQADANKDMHLNAEELENLFTNAKKEHKDELTKGIEDSVKSILEGWDTNKDGQLSLMEFTEHMQNNPDAAKHPSFKGWHAGFKEADVNKDMHLTTDELTSLLTKVVNDEHKDHPLHDEM